MAHPVTDTIADAAQEQFGRYEPESGLEWETFMDSVGGFFDQFAQAFSGLGEKLGNDFPMGGTPTEGMWEDMGATLRGLADHGQAMAQQFKIDFEKELERLRNPRPGEEVFDRANEQ